MPACPGHVDLVPGHINFVVICPTGQMIFLVRACTYFPSRIHKLCRACTNIGWACKNVCRARQFSKPSAWACKPNAWCQALHHKLWPTSGSHPFSFLNSSLGLAGEKHYQKIIIPAFKIVLQKVTFLIFFSIAIFSPYFLLVGLLLQYVSAREQIK